EPQARVGRTPFLPTNAGPNRPALSNLLIRYLPKTGLDCRRGCFPTLRNRPLHPFRVAPAAHEEKARVILLEPVGGAPPTVSVSVIDIDRILPSLIEPSRFEQLVIRRGDVTQSPRLRVSKFQIDDLRHAKVVGKPPIFRAMIRQCRARVVWDHFSLQ